MVDLILKPLYLLNTAAKEAKFSFFADIIVEIISVALALILGIAVFRPVFTIIFLIAFSIFGHWIIHGGSGLLYMITLPAFRAYTAKIDKSMSRVESELGIRYFIEKEKNEKPYSIRFFRD